MSESTLLESLRHLPAPAAKRVALHVTPPAERSIRQGHPWLFAPSLESQSHEGNPGDLAVVFDRKRRFLAIGLYDPTSQIRMRVLHSGAPVTINQEWFTQRLAEVFALRAPLQDPLQETDGYRLINGENDGFGGLVLDRFHDTLVLKLYTAAWIPHLVTLTQALVSLVPHTRLVLRLSRTLLQNPKLLHGLRDGQILSGPDLAGPVIFQENGIRFEAEPIIGQKTGFFLDQRDNRMRVCRLARGLSVLNVFSYTGGFSVYAARGGATDVTSVDISVPATEASKRNWNLNRHFPEVDACKHFPLAVDAFEALEDMNQRRKRFDMVILDPPMFAQSTAQVPNALQAYQRLTRLGLTVLKPGGILVQASCSARVPADDFFGVIYDEAEFQGRPLEEIERTGHAIDHPSTFREGAYLKCLFARA